MKMVAHTRLVAHGLRTLPATLLLTFGSAAIAPMSAQVFTVGEKTATASLKTDFTPTRVELPDKPMTERGRRELIRDLEAEQGFAHRVLPLGAILTLEANGNLTPRPEQYKEVIYKKGQSAAPGDRVMVTALEIKPDRILVDLNGGPYVRHRFLRHVQIGVGGAVTAPPDLSEQATGCRIMLVFEGKLPEVSAPEVKALLQPVVDFGAKTGEIAYAETLPAPIKSAIDSHEVLVGMNHRMVLAALGQPEAKLREGATEGRYEEWIYGHQPQPVKFVRFVGDRVNLVKIAAVGKPVEVHDQDEMAGYLPPVPTRTVALGDQQPTQDNRSGPPTLKRPGETLPVENGGTTNRKVQYPEDQPSATSAPADSTSPSPAPSSSGHAVSGVPPQ